METFKPFSFTVHVTRTTLETNQKCQICKATIPANSIVVLSNGHEDLGWFVKYAHLDCLKGLIEEAYVPLLNQEVHVTSKVTREGGKVEVAIGKNVFTLTPEQAYRFAAALVLSSVSAAFDAWLHRTMERFGFISLPVLVRVRKLRGQKMITDASVLGNTNGLLLDCWGMLRTACQEEFDWKNDAQFLTELEKEFRAHFGIEEGQGIVQ